MSDRKKKSNATAVGSFVIGATALLIATVMILWSGKLFTHSYSYVLYFTGDVNGLFPGAKVKFKGVEVGFVDHIMLSLSNGDNQTPSLLIPVVINLNSKTTVHEGTGRLELDDPEVVRNLVAKGLRGQIASESIVTGVLYVSLDIRPDTPAHFLSPPDSAYPEIPTLPTAFEQAQELAMEALTKLGKIDFDKVLSELSGTVAAVSNLARSAQLKASLDVLPSTINRLGSAADAIQRLANNANSQLGSTTASIRKASMSATVALEQTQATLKSVRETVGPGSPLPYQLGQTLTDLSQAARSMRELADYLNRNPSAIVRGRPNGAGQ
ncbi:MAG TPA: MlaD family protein [Candidatus Binataceae bacterium]|nr:MlaD family protein [Candidatus Binataceae bacterium]